MSQSAISKDTNLSRNTVQKSWRWLQQVGLLEPCEDIHVARRPGRQMSATVWTVYQFPNQRIEQDITPNHWHDAAQEPTQEELEALGQTVMFADGDEGGAR